VRKPRERGAFVVLGEHLARGVPVGAAFDRLIMIPEARPAVA